MRSNLWAFGYDVDGTNDASLCLFFFQAEDGIRDLTVTGVQTCALPIYSSSGLFWKLAPPEGAQNGGASFQKRPELESGLESKGVVAPPSVTKYAKPRERSEERRVGKECRSRGVPDH